MISCSMFYLQFRHVYPTHADDPRLGLMTNPSLIASLELLALPPSGVSPSRKFRAVMPGLRTVLPVRGLRVAMRVGSLFLRLLRRESDPSIPSNISSLSLTVAACLREWCFLRCFFWSSPSSTGTYGSESRDAAGPVVSSNPAQAMGALRCVAGSSVSYSGELSAARLIACFLRQRQTRNAARARPTTTPTTMPAMAPAERLSPAAGLPDEV